MDFGISSACFYPLETEKSFKMIGEMGIKKAEIFFNSTSELSGPFFSEILSVKENYGIDVVSVHPGTSACEPLFFFSDYERRFYEMLEFYKRYFEVCEKLDSKIFVMHGMRKFKQIPVEQYCERFLKICLAGKDYGVNVSQENVHGFVSGDVSYLKEMKKYLKDDFHLVFDVKQMRRCGYTHDDFLNEFSDNIINVHISDGTKEKDCLPPGVGDYDLKGLLEKLKKVSYDGCCLVELYRENYADYSQLKKSYEYLCNIDI